MLLVLTLCTVHSWPVPSSLPARVPKSFSTELLLLVAFPRLYCSEGFSFPFLLVDFSEVWVGPLLQPVKVTADTTLSLSTLTGDIITNLMPSANLMTVLHHHFLLISISILKVRSVKFLITLEQRRQMFKVRGISLGKSLWIRMFCSSPNFS